MKPFIPSAIAAIVALSFAACDQAKNAAGDATTKSVEDAKAAAAKKVDDAKASANAKIDAAKDAAKEKAPAAAAAIE